MSTDSRGLPRRDFLKILAAAGAGTLLPARIGRAADVTTSDAAASTVVTRPFGKTGVQVSILSVGGMFDIGRNQVLMKKALEWGVTYWDTADCYNYGGPTEAGIGKYFSNHPGSRKEIFLVTKSDARDPAGMSKLLARSLERLQTDYVDLYFIHGIWSIDEMTPEMKAWADRARKEGKIRFFGFSTHHNMAECLAGAAKLGWIDGAMFTYNYRIMHKDNMKSAVDAAHRAGIGLTAMKTQGGGSVKTDSPKELRLAGRFLQRGFTAEQARLKAIWEDERIACICSQMPTLPLLAANVAAALDRTKLTAADHDALDQYAADTCSGYCAGCGNLCSAAAGGLPVSDVMRCLMYHRSYGDAVLARSEFAKLGPDIRARLAGTDYSAAEQRCPHALPIGRLVKEASDILA